MPSMSSSSLSFLRSGAGRPVSAPPMRIDLYHGSPSLSKASSRRGSTISASGFSRRVPVSMVALLATSGNSNGSKFVASRPSSAASMRNNDHKEQWKTPSNGHVTVPRSAKREKSEEQKDEAPAPKNTRENNSHLHVRSRASISHHHGGEIEKHIELVHSLPIFHDLPRDKLFAIAHSIKKAHCTFGTVLVRQGHPVSRIFVVQSGQVSIERKMLNGGKECGILKSCLKKSANRSTENISSARVKIQTGLPGSVFGDFPALFDAKSNETATVESISGAEILSISLHDLHQHVDAANIAAMKEKARRAAQFRQDQAKKQADIMASAVNRYAGRQTISIAYPSQEELNKINRKMKFDVWHPIGWREKPSQKKSLPPRPNSAPPRPSSAPPRQTLASAHTAAHSHALSALPESAALVPDMGDARHAPPHPAQRLASSALSVDHLREPTGSGFQVTRERERPASAMTVRRDRDGDEDSEAPTAGKRPSSAFVPSRKKWETGPPIWEANKYGECQDINYRKLFLSTWSLPERHMVYTGAKIAVSAASAEDVPHVELDIDAIEDLDGTYLATFQ